MIYRDVRAIIKNVEHEDSENLFIVAKAVADDNTLWYYGRYPTFKRAMEVAKDITYEGVVGFVVFDDISQIRDIKKSIDCAEEMKRFNSEKYKEEFTDVDKLRVDSSAYDQIKEIVGWSKDS